MSFSFGWVYQANTGVFLIGRNIRPSDPVTFFQPACTNATEGSTPCDHNTKTFHGNKYLVVGTERESADGSFTLDVTSDFIGRPKTEMFCGNTICLNAVSFYETLSQSGIGVTLRQVRSLRIDTTTIPDYSQVDLASFEPSSRDVLANSTKSHSKNYFAKQPKNPIVSRTTVKRKAKIEGIVGRKKEVTPRKLQQAQHATRRMTGSKLTNYAGSSQDQTCLLYTSPSPRDGLLSRMPSSA